MILEIFDKDFYFKNSNSTFIYTKFSMNINVLLILK